MAQQYRHGVLIGNWNEDQYGIERAQDPASSGTGLSTREHYLSIAKASYNRPDESSLKASHQDRLAIVDRRAGVGSALLAQESANPQGEFTTTYASFGQGQEGTLAPDYTLSRTHAVKVEKIDRINMDFTGMRGSYHTDYRDNYRPEHSLHAQSAEERTQLASNLKKNTLTNTFQRPHTQLRLNEEMSNSWLSGLKLTKNKTPTTSSPRIISASSSNGSSPLVIGQSQVSALCSRSNSPHTPQKKALPQNAAINAGISSSSPSSLFLGPSTSPVSVAVLPSRSTRSPATPKQSHFFTNSLAPSTTSSARLFGTSSGSSSSSREYDDDVFDLPPDLIPNTEGPNTMETSPRHVDTTNNSLGVPPNNTSVASDFVDISKAPNKRKRTMSAANASPSPTTTTRTRGPRARTRNPLPDTREERMGDDDSSINDSLSAMCVSEGTDQELNGVGKRASKSRKSANNGADSDESKSMDVKSEGNDIPTSPPSHSAEQISLKSDTWEENSIVDVLSPAVTLMALGINPGRASASAQYAYAGTANHFWPLMLESGILPYRGGVGKGIVHVPQERVLDYGVGLCNIVDRPTRSSSDLNAQEMTKGAQTLLKKIIRVQPFVLLVNGKCIWDAMVKWGCEQRTHAPYMGRGTGTSFGISKNSGLGIVKNSRECLLGDIHDALHGCVTLSRNNNDSKTNDTDVKMGPSVGSCVDSKNGDTFAGKDMCSCWVAQMLHSDAISLSPTKSDKSKSNSAKTVSTAVDDSRGGAAADAEDVGRGNGIGSGSGGAGVATRTRRAGKQNANVKTHPHTGVNAQADAEVEVPLETGGKAGAEDVKMEAAADMHGGAAEDAYTDRNVGAEGSAAASVEETEAGGGVNAHVPASVRLSLTSSCPLCTGTQTHTTTTTTTSSSSPASASVASAPDLSHACNSNGTDIATDMYTCTCTGASLCPACGGIPICTHSPPHRPCSLPLALFHHADIRTAASSPLQDTLTRLSMLSRPPHVGLLAPVTATKLGPPPAAVTTLSGKKLSGKLLSKPIFQFGIQPQWIVSRVFPSQVAKNLIVVVAPSSSPRVSQNQRHDKLIHYQWALAVKHVAQHLRSQGNRKWIYE